MFNLKNEQIKLILYFFYVLIFIYFTTENLSLYDLIYTANQSDIVSFYEIANKSPDFAFKSDIIAKHDAQRFLVPYTIGFISYLTDFNLFKLYKSINLIFVILSLILIFFITNKLKLDFRSSIVFFSLFFFNPYTIRYGIFNPIQVHDMIFFICAFLIGYGIVFERKKTVFFYSLFSLFLRQTAIAYIISIVVLFFLKNKTFGRKILYLYIISAILSFYVIIQVGEIMSTSNFPISNAYNLFFYDFSKLNELFRFLALPLVSFIPIFLMFLTKKKNKIDLKIILIFFICLMMIAQPILGGPLNSGRNVVRIASLCYPILLIGVFYLLDFSSLLKKNYIFYSLLVFFHLWSLHPTFSKIEFFGFLRF